MTNTIKIKCNAENTLELAELTEFQGGLKQRTDIDYDKIKLSICKYGFSFPFFVWKNGSKNYLLDGHGRFATLCKMQKDGYTIPSLPVVYVSCKDKKEAEEKYGEVDREFIACQDEGEVFNIGYVLGAEPREKRIAELEAENAELKDYRLTTLAKQQTDMSKYALKLEHKLSWYDDQLTKAKELLKQWLSLCGFKVEKLAKDTEQFLNSEVEK